MFINPVRQYRSKETGNLVFVYEVNGNAEGLEAFKTAQGDFHRTDEDSGKPLYFTTRVHPAKTPLLITADGNVAVDTSAMDRKIALANEHAGTQLGEMLSKQIADELLKAAEKFAVASTPSEEVPIEEAAEEASEDMGGI